MLRTLTLCLALVTLSACVQKDSSISAQSAVTRSLKQSAGKRVALIVGNGAYEGAEARLPNPPNDAVAMAAKLRVLDFVVIEAIDLDFREMKSALHQFNRALQDADAGLFFYAGHGMEYQGRNYLFPTDSVLETEGDIGLSLIDVRQVLQVMESSVPTRLIFLDACRNNPLARRFRSTLGLTRSTRVGTGLARIDATVGTFIAYATAPGELAEDGAGSNSPFTEAMLRHLDEPGLDVSQLMRRIRNTVLNATNERQVPWNSSSLRGPFIFNLGEPIIASPTPNDDEVPQVEKPPLNPAGPVAPPIETVGVPSDYDPLESFRDCSSCPEMVMLPAGSFIMGSPEDEEGREDTEGPQHKVTFSRNFAIAKNEVTYSEFERFANSTGVGAPPRRRRVGGIIGLFDSPGRYPVPVGWEQARGYCEWLAHETGKDYRLPSEAEWEYAARAGTRSRYSFGRYINKKQASFGEYSKTSYAGGISKVGSFPPNPWGLHDMHGNIAEFVADSWHSDYVGAPTDGSAWIDATSRDPVMRGGSSGSSVLSVRSASRDSGRPRRSYQGFGTPYQTTTYVRPRAGFRCARDG